MTNVLKVCLPNTLRDSFDYLAGSFNPVNGARVWVTFRKKKRLGLVVERGIPECDLTSIKPIDDLIDNEPLLNDDMLDLCRWVSRYYQSPLSEVIPLALPKKIRDGIPIALPTINTYQLAMPLTEAQAQLDKKAKKQHALLEFLAKENTAVSEKILSQHHFSKLLIQKLIEKQIIVCRQEIDKPCCLQQGQQQPLTLHPEQAEAVNILKAHLNSYKCFLLQGVTGSGKTEVYLQLIADVLNTDRQVLVLVPEIGLTPQLLTRFRARVAEPIVVIHSGLNESERYEAWLLAKSMHVRLVIGTRAAVFTPLPKLGLIIIDEEHDLSLKQMDSVRYSARDTALIRAYRANIPIVLGSATPSLESLHNCQQHKYNLLRLTHKAMNDIPLFYRVIDLRNTPTQHGLAESTLALIDEHLQRKNQVMVFINRRGFSPVLLCHLCGWIADCRACDSHLTLHRQSNHLICHHCGAARSIPKTCGQCQHHELIPIGAGTQRLHEFLQAYFPHTNVMRIDRDSVRKKNEFDAKLNDINQGNAQLIVGTQMLAKGHHFPKLTLVVIADADMGFYNPDFRALEQLGQLLIQVSGRAGRAEHGGEVVIQTHLPHHPLLNILIQKGYEAFSTALLTMRKEANLPPYYHLALIRVQDKQKGKLLHFLKNIKDYLNDKNIQAFGPAPAPLARKANYYRMQLLLKSASRKHLQAILTELCQWLTNNKKAGTIRWNIDVDPMDLS